MRQEEAAKLNDEIYAEVCEKGVPIDIRTGSHVAAADWIRKLLTKHIKIDTPIGVIDDIEYDFCPNCRHVVGAAALYCKHCGSMIREKVQT